MIKKECNSYTQNLQNVLVKQNNQKPSQTTIVNNKTPSQSKPLSNKTSTTTKQKIQITQRDENEQNITQQLPRLRIITIQLIKASQYKKSLKDLEDVLKVNAQKVKLIIDSKFEFDSDLLNFSIVLNKIAHKINYLKWKINGQFSDSQSKVIGESLMKFTLAFSIDLEIHSNSFGEKGANSLSLALKKFQNLHILKLNIPNLRLGTTNNALENGITKINQSISTLQNLEVVFFDRLDFQGLIIPKNMSSSLYFLFCQTFDDQEDQKCQKESFFKQIGGIQKKITSLYIRNYIFYYEDKTMNGMYDCIQDESIDPDQYVKVIIQIILWCYDFPYLTKFNDLIVDRDKLRMAQLQQQLSNNFKYKKFLSLIKSHTNQKLINIIQIITFYNNFIEQITINPSLIIIDLLID